jgi:multisubunit Na+/H+ antiporter MnhG subunit
MARDVPTPGPQPDTGAAHDGEVVHGGHGTSIAAWTATIGIMVGSLVVAIFMIFWSVPMIIVGAAIILLSALAGPVLVRAGYGEKVPNREYTGGPRAVR